MFINILIILVESLYFYIALKNIKNINKKVDKIKLFIGIIFADLLSEIIFHSSIFRYILYPAIIFIVLKMINKETRFYDFFVIVSLIGFKILIEFLVVLLFLKGIITNYCIIVCIFETLSILLICLLKKNINKLYKLISKEWNNKNEFYVRYLFLIIFNFLILFFIFNLIKVKEVL